MPDKVLVIAEKPSVGKSIASVVGASERRNGYMEGSEFVVSWCFGHLMKTAPPEAYGPQYKNWDLDTLPIIPTHWQYCSTNDSQDQLDILKALMDRKDIASVVCATDAGREGELIFRLVYEAFGCTKKVRRLWVSSLEPKAISAGMDSLRPSSDYDNLYAAALCRQKADWLVGMNATRLYTVLHREANGVSSVGRVQTPTLEMIVRRQEEIDAFASKPFYTVALVCDGFELLGERLGDKAAAQAVADKARQSQAVVQSCTCTAKKTAPPLLYDLTSLQREANKRYGIQAEATLRALQELYEEQLATYPRTDSRYITTDMVGAVEDLAKAVWSCLCKGTCKPNVQVLADDSKVTDHHALMPTMTFAKKGFSGLAGDKLLVMRLIATRLLCATASPCLYDETKVVATCAGSPYSGSGTVERDAGWRGVERSVLGSAQRGEGANEFPPLSSGDVLDVSRVDMREGKTSPPRQYTEDTLLGAMEKAGTKDLPDAVERRGLGTSSTRAATIERLVSVGYVQRRAAAKQKGKGGKTEFLVPTPKGIALVGYVDEAVKSVDMTVDWESRLLEVERGKLDAGVFIKGVQEYVRRFVKEGKDGDELAGSGEVLGKCPWCGADVADLRGVAKCTNDGCSFAIYRGSARWRALGQMLTSDQVRTLLGTRRVMLHGLVGKSGKPFDAEAVLCDGRDVLDNGRQLPKIDLQFAQKEEQLVGKCPWCGGEVWDDGTRAACRSCEVRVWHRGKLWDSLGYSPSLDQVRALFRDRKVRLEGLRSRSGGKTGAMWTLVDASPDVKYPSKLEFDRDTNTRKFPQKRK